MAYFTHYTANFTNQNNNVVEVAIMKKDVPPSFVQNYEVTQLSINSDSDEGTIIAHECILGIWVPEEDLYVDWDTFLVSNYDEWFLSVTVDGQLHFEGFLMPEEGSTDFRDKPYEIVLRASNGLKLLKQVQLSDLNGDSFDGTATLIDYVSACLQKTLMPDFPIRIFGSIYESSMLDRGDDITYDYYQQTKLNARSFLKSPNEFVSCYDALLLILQRHSRLFYHMGRWTIFYLYEHQYRPGGLFYTDYDSSGAVIDGGEDTEGYASVGIFDAIFPVSGDQKISANFSIKAAKTIYDYDVPPNLLNNEALTQLGASISSGNITDGGGVVIGTYNTFEIVGWVHKKQFLSEVNPVTNAYIRVEKDLYNRETARFYVVERDATPPVDAQTLNYIRNINTDYYVRKGDKVDISITCRLNANINDIWGACSLLIFTGGSPSSASNYYALDPFGAFQGPGAATLFGWAQYAAAIDKSEWQTHSLQGCTIPVSGNIVVKLQCGFAPGAATEGHYKDLRIDYRPFLGGGYFEAKGDYWLHEQNQNILDKDEENMGTSDTDIRILKGALFRSDGVTATTPTWYRYGITESKHFKELVNLFRFNLAYRRFRKVQGSFNGLKYAPTNALDDYFPLSYHKEYEFTNYGDRRFILVPPLQIDCVKGWSTAIFQEVVDPAVSGDGTEDGDKQEYNYIFEK